MYYIKVCSDEKDNMILPMNLLQSYAHIKFLHLVASINCKRLKKNVTMEWYWISRELVASMNCKNKNVTVEWY